MGPACGGGASSPPAACIQQEGDAKWRQHANRDFSANAAEGSQWEQQPPGKELAVPVLTRRKSWKSSARFQVLSHCPSTRLSYASSKLWGALVCTRKFTLLTGCFLCSGCTNWSWCLLQAQRSKAELFMDLLCSYGSVTPPGAGTPIQGTIIDLKNHEEIRETCTVLILIFFCLLMSPLLQGLLWIRPLTRLFRSSPNKRQIGLQNISRCSQNNQIKASPLCMQRKQHFLWMDGHSLFSSQSLT